MRLYLIWVLLFITSCSSLEQIEVRLKEKFNSKNNEPISFDLSLLEQYHSSMLFKEKFKTPFLSSYSYGDKKLSYLALDNLEDNGPKIHTMLKKIYADLKPQFVIVTGSAFTVISDQDDINYALECEKKRFEFCNIDAYAIYLADDQDIAFDYGTPSDAALFASLKRNGVKNNELTVYYTLKILVQSNNKNKVNLNNALKEASKKTRSLKTLTEQAFKKRFKQLMNADFKIENVTSALLNPFEVMDPRWSNKLALMIDTLEEKFLIHQIEIRLNKYKNILVISNAHHLFKERSMLNSKLGRAEDSEVKN